VDLVIAVFENSSPHDADQIREILSEAGAMEGRTWRLGGSTVLLVPDATAEVAERVQRTWPAARVAFPVSGAPLAARETFGADTVVPIGPVPVGGPAFTVMAGPCAVESAELLLASARAVKVAGAVVLRGGAFKPRTSPYSFQGTGVHGLRLLAEARAATGLPVVSEVVDPRQVELVAEHADALQVGTRNAQNFTLLSEVGRTGRPVLLKRGFGCTVDEWLHAAEYVLREGHGNVVLCERGIRSFESATRFTLDLAAVAVVKQRSHLPVVVDPSHGTGHRSLVAPLALAAAAAGADGLLIDVHADPAFASCDGAQALRPNEFMQLMTRLRGVLSAVDRTLPGLRVAAPPLAETA
jgi:3-deoxy-7-phosphoheptulonate synthase